MISHHFNEERRSGYFANEYGYKICHWNWDPYTKTLRVRVGYTEHPVQLSRADYERLSEEELLERLVELAKSTGRALGARFGP